MNAAWIPADSLIDWSLLQQFLASINENMGIVAELGKLGIVFSFLVHPWPLKWFVVQADQHKDSCILLCPINQSINQHTGCGSGFPVAHHIAQTLRVSGSGIRYIGIDLSEEQIDIAKQLLAKDQDICNFTVSVSTPCTNKGTNTQGPPLLLLLLNWKTKLYYTKTKQVREMMDWCRKQPDNSIAGIIALFSIFHLPRNQVTILLSWLPPPFAHSSWLWLPLLARGFVHSDQTNSQRQCTFSLHNGTQSSRRICGQMVWRE